MMITPQKHLPLSSRLYRPRRYDLILCSIGGADTIMQHVGTGVITVFPHGEIKKRPGEKTWSDDDDREAETYN